MKKLFTLFMGLFLMLPLAFSQSYWNQYLIKEDFDGLTALPSGWSYISGTTAVFGRGAGTPAFVNGLEFIGSGGGNRGGEIKFALTPDSSTIYVDFDLQIAKSNVGFKNSFQFYLLGSHSTNVNASAGAFADVIAGVYLVGSSGKFHVWNKDIKGPSPVAYPDSVVPVFQSGQYPNFSRAGASNQVADSLNLNTKSEVIHKFSKWYALSFKLNFKTKKLDFTITQKDSTLNTQTFTDLDFIAKTATDFVSFGMVNNRASSAGNGGNANLDATIDNFKVYQKVKSLGHADVTVNYQDLDGNTVKTSRIETNQEVGLNFQLLNSDKESFKDASYYYAYDAVATGSEIVAVTPTGATITVKFKKTALTSGTYVWKGTTSGSWDEIDSNFSTDGSNQLGYQPGNAVSFSDDAAPIKQVNLTKRFDLGAGNVIVDAKGYTVKNTAGEILTGTGSIQVNATASLGLSTLSKMPVYLNKDTLTVTNADLTNKYYVKDGTALQPQYTMSTPIQGEGGTFTLLSKVYNYTSAIKGVNTVKCQLQAKGVVNPAKISGVIKMYCTLDSLADLYVNSLTNDTTYFGTTVNYKNNKVHLGDHVFMAYTESPSATTATTVEIGELSGSAMSKLIGPNVRTVNYKVGGLNTDATFAGEFKPIHIDNWSNRTDFNLEKVGKGTWTLSGNSPDFFGTLKVTDGTLVVNDTLCNAKGSYTLGGATINKYLTSVTVADTATIAGKGYIGCSLNTINGTVTGKLTFAGAVTLKPDIGLGGAKTIINVNGTDIDKITAESDFSYGGKLIVKVVGDLPPAGEYQIIKAENYYEKGVNGFDTIELPSSDWSFDYTKGTLKYVGGTGVPVIDANKTVESIEYFDMTGKKINEYYKGFVIMRVKYTDGTIGSYKTFKKQESR